VSAWADKSGNGLTLTQGTSSAQPAFTGAGLAFAGGQSLGTSTYTLSFSSANTLCFAVRDLVGGVLIYKGVLGAPWTTTDTKKVWLGNGATSAPINEASVGLYPTVVGYAEGYDMAGAPLGTTGPQILALQQYLNSHDFTVATFGPGSQGHETRDFGKATRAAVIKFQIAHHISPTGNVGPLTRAALNKAS
jgi:hypothetical protein